MFAQIVDFETTDDNMNASDLTTKDAIIKENADEVIEEVAANISAIGYVSHGSLFEADGVKSLLVDGKSSEDNSEKYPLSRNFYLAHSGELNDLE